MGGSKLDANTYLKWITFKCKSTICKLFVFLTIDLRYPTRQLVLPNHGCSCRSRRIE